MSEKKAILEKIVDTLRSEYEVLAKALVDSSAAATDPDSKAEGKYDTRSLEMSYLASGQARQAQVLEESIALLDSLSLRAFAVTDCVASGSLIELEREGVWERYFLLPAGGGVTVDYEGQTVTVLTPDSPLFELLDGARMGEPLTGGVSVSELA